MGFGFKDSVKWELPQKGVPLDPGLHNAQGLYEDYGGSYGRLCRDYFVTHASRDSYGGIMLRIHSPLCLGAVRKLIRLCCLPLHVEF